MTSEQVIGLFTVTGYAIFGFGIGFFFGQISGYRKRTKEEHK